MRECQHGQVHLREDIASEQAHFNRYFQDADARAAADGYMVEGPWVARACAPRERPLDYWEYTFHLLGRLEGQSVLDIGCGSGWITTCLAHAGASVTAFDVAIQGARLTERMLKHSGFRAGGVAVMDAHQLGFRAESFDAALITGALHHLSIEKVAAEVHRVLRPGGRLVFYEPLDYGPVMWAIRQIWLRFHGMKEYDTTAHEEGLQEEELEPFHRLFARGHVRRLNFLAKTNRLRRRFGPFAEGLRWADYLLLSAVPFLRRYCTCIVARFEK